MAEGIFYLIRARFDRYEIGFQLSSKSLGSKDTELTANMENTAPSAPNLSFSESTEPLLRHYEEPFPYIIPIPPQQDRPLSPYQPPQYQSHYATDHYPQVIESVSISDYHEPAPHQTSTPVMIVCDRCRNRVRTITVPTSGACTYIACLACCFFGMWPCYLYPFCIDSLKDIRHICPICNNVLGSKKPCS